MDITFHIELGKGSPLVQIRMDVKTMAVWEKKWSERLDPQMVGRHSCEFVVTANCMRTSKSRRICYALVI